MEKKVDRPGVAKKFAAVGAAIAAFCAPMLALAASPYSTGSGSIPSGTATSFLTGSISYILYPVNQFIFQSEMINLILVLVGIGLVVFLAVMVPKAVMAWFRRHRH